MGGWKRRKQVIIDQKTAEDELRKREKDFKAKRYFALPVFPIDSPCWACGKSQSKENKVELLCDVCNTEPFDGRRTIMVVCSNCGAGNRARPIGGTKKETEEPNEI